jgi:hypothetical protein
MDSGIDTVQTLYSCWNVYAITLRRVAEGLVGRKALVFAQLARPARVQPTRRTVPIHSCEHGVLWKSCPAGKWCVGGCKNVPGAGSC